MTFTPIYLDYNATTPLDPTVLDAMLPYFKEAFGNPASSTHCYGWKADLGLRKARGQVASLLGCEDDEIIFTSGATESNNMTILGLLHAQEKQGSQNKAPYHFITSAVEHKAVLDVMREVEQRGHEVTVLPVNAHGQVHPKQVEESLKANTLLVSIMHANNEVGSINPISEIGRIVQNHGAYFHSDATQTVGKDATLVDDLNVDFLSLSGHKMCGPKGIGALYIRRRGRKAPLKSLFFGGAQEGGIRPGTPNVPGIVGLGAACAIAQEVMREESQRLRSWRDQIIEKVKKVYPQARLNGHPSERLCNTISFSFPDLKGDLLALGLHRLAVSSGSACTSGSGQASHVLNAMGLPDALARSTLRMGLGRFTTEAEVSEATKILCGALEQSSCASTNSALF